MASIATVEFPPEPGYPSTAAIRKGAIDMASADRLVLNPHGFMLRILSISRPVYLDDTNAHFLCRFIEQSAAQS